MNSYMLSYISLAVGENEVFWLFSQSSNLFHILSSKNYILIIWVSAFTTPPQKKKKSKPLSFPPKNSYWQSGCEEIPFSTFLLLVANLQTLLPLPPYNSGHQWELQNIFYYLVRREGRPYIIGWPIFFYLLDISASIQYRKIAFTYSSLVWDCILNECLLGWQSVTFFMY